MKKNRQPVIVSEKDDFTTRNTVSLLENGLVSLVPPTSRFAGKNIAIDKNNERQNAITL